MPACWDDYEDVVTVDGVASGTADITLTLPGIAAVGHLAIACFIDRSQTLAQPGGWTELDYNGARSSFFKILTSADITAGSFTFTCNADEVYGIICVGKPRPIGALHSGYIDDHGEHSNNNLPAGLTSSSSSGDVVVVILVAADDNSGGSLPGGIGVCDFGDLEVGGRNLEADYGLLRITEAGSIDQGTNSGSTPRYCVAVVAPFDITGTAPLVGAVGFG